MLQQANQFYPKLNELLIKLQQNVYDYRMARDLQKNDFLSGRGGGAPPQ